MYIAAIDEYPLARRMGRYRREEKYRIVSDFFNCRKAVLERDFIGNNFLTGFRIIKSLDPFCIQRRPAFADYDGIDADFILEERSSPFTGQAQDSTFGCRIGTRFTLARKSRLGCNIEDRAFALNQIRKSGTDEFIIMGQIAMEALFKILPRRFFDCFVIVAAGIIYDAINTTAAFRYVIDNRFNLIRIIEVDEMELIIGAHSV